MPIDVIFPKVSLDQDSGNVARWCVSQGDSVVEGQVLFEIDNDKAAVEVVAPAAGIVQGLIECGINVTTGTTVAQIFPAGTVAEAAPPSSPAVSLAGQPHTASPGRPQMIKAQGGLSRRPPNPTPLARRLAREQDVRLDELIGTGPGGRVQKKDVLAVLDARGTTITTSIVKDASKSASGEPLLNAAWLRNGDGIAVVLLHGYSADLNNWRGLLAGGRSRWPALAIDLPAHGQSTREIPADFDEIAEQVEATLASLGLGPVVLAGHSLGAAAAIRLARRGFVDVRGTCLFAPAGLGPEIHAPFVDGIVRAERAESLRPWLELLVHDPATISENFVRLVEKQRQDRELTQAMRAFAGRFFPDGTQRFSIVNDLGGLPIPTRVVFGREDRILPFAATRGLPDNVALHAFGDCGHMPHIEKPELSMRILNEIWQSAAS